MLLLHDSIYEASFSKSIRNCRLKLKNLHRQTMWLKREKGMKFHMLFAL